MSSYSYILRRYGIEVPVGGFVQHNVTGRFGEVRPATGDTHYVQVLFEGDRHTMPCHPEELEYETAPVAGRRLQKIGAL